MERQTHEERRRSTLVRLAVAAAVAVLVGIGEAIGAGIWEDVLSTIFG